MKIIKVPWKSWYADEMFKLSFPEVWDVDTFPMNDASPVKDEDVRKAFRAPIGSTSLRKIAQEKKKAAIVVDDLSRPTPVRKILTFVFNELKEAGLEKKNIQIIIALGAHRPMLRQDLIRKLGKSIYDSVPVYNHHPFENIVNLGTSTAGTPIQINKPFMDADIKIGIGCIVPHPYAGFGGGGKIVLPGISGIDTLQANHQSAIRGIKGGIGLIEGNEVREDIEEIAQKVGLNFIINVVVNSKREVAGLFAGDIIKAHREGVKFARRVYSTNVDSNLDVAIFNAYPKDTDLVQSPNALNAYLSAENKIIKKRGVIVIATASPEGEGFHSLEGFGMRLFEYVDKVPFIKKRIQNRTICLFSPYLAHSDVAKYYSSSVLFFNKWGKLIEYLKQKFPHNCRVGVFPHASIQLLESRIS